MSVEIELRLENSEEIQMYLERFPRKAQVELGRAIDKDVPRLEKELKGRGAFHDRTGKLRRALYVITRIDPIGIIFGADTPYASYVAFGHGTWTPTWFVEFIEYAAQEVVRILDEALTSLLEKESKGEG